MKLFKQDIQLKDEKVDSSLSIKNQRHPFKLTFYLIRYLHLS